MDIEAPTQSKSVFQQPLTKLLHIAFFFLALLMLMPIDPAILCVLWNWFAVKVGFHILSYGYAFGLLLILRFIVNPGLPVTINREKGKSWPDNPQDLWFPVARTYIGRIITLGAGVIIHLLLSHG